MQNVFILGSARTAIGKFGGALKDQAAHKLGAVAIREALRRAGVAPERVDEVILGQILQAGQGQGPGRQASLAAGVPKEVPAWTVNQLCGSGLKTVILAAQAIRAGDAACVVAGGQENMSLSPYLLPAARAGAGMGHATMQDSMILDALTDAFSGDHMGLTAEAIAERYKITREEQDAFAAESQRRAGAALAAGRFAAECVPYMIPQRKGDPVAFAVDEYPRPETTAASLAKLRPAFKKDGTVTAGNASGINDGAAALVVASEAFVKESGAKPVARIAGYATTALEPYYMGLGPVEASRRALAQAGFKVADLDRIEANEAFAAQALAVMRDLGLDPAKTNPDGGAIALGHPVGASGARILVTLLHGLARTGGRRGLATLCVGGGMGVAVAVEMI